MVRYTFTLLEWKLDVCRFCSAADGVHNRGAPERGSGQGGRGLSAVTTSHGHQETGGAQKERKISMKQPAKKDKRAGTEINKA